MLLAVYLFQETGKDWKKGIKNWEGFVYPWLERKYGLEKLQDIWQKMFKEGETITKAVEDVYGKDINKLEEDFKKDILKAKDYSLE